MELRGELLLVGWSVLSLLTVGCACFPTRAPIPTPTPADAVQVVGQVAHPSALPYHVGMTAIDAILAVGGLTTLSPGNRVARIVRMENGKETIIHVKVADFVNGDAQSALLKPGDVLVVP